MNLCEYIYNTHVQEPVEARRGALYLLELELGGCETVSVLEADIYLVFWKTRKYSSAVWCLYSSLLCIDNFKTSKYQYVVLTKSVLRETRLLKAVALELGIQILVGGKTEIKEIV